MRRVLAALTAAAFLPVLAACDDGSVGFPLRISGVARTADPSTVLVPIDESTTAVGGDCWTSYRISAAGQSDGSIVITEIEDHQDTPKGASCADLAVPMFQQVKLPAPATKDRLIDASTGKPIPWVALPPGQPAAAPAPPNP